MRNAVLYHADADGFGAAYACWKYFREYEMDLCTVDFIPVQYNQSFPELKPETKEIFIVDFSYSEEVHETLWKSNHSLLVVDHHITAGGKLIGKNYAVFNTAKSGSELTWMTLLPEHTLPDILRYVGDRDLWKFELEFSREVNLYIASLPWDFEVWDNFDLHTAIISGRAIAAFQDQQIENRVKAARAVTMHVGEEEFIVPIVNCTENVSEVGNALCKEHPNCAFSVTFAERKDGKMSYSLRSVGEFDVSRIAKYFGGGGHKNAAGFTNPPHMKSEIFE